MSGSQSPGLLLSPPKMRSQESWAGAGGEYVSAGKRDNFDNGEEEDDAAHNFKRSDHVLPIDNMYIEHICKYTYENWVVT